MLYYLTYELHKLQLCRYNLLYIIIYSFYIELRKKRLYFQPSCSLNFEIIRLEINLKLENIVFPRISAFVFANENLFYKYKYIQV